MMFAPNSRYYTVPVATLQSKDQTGAPTELRYVLRRFIGRARPSVLAQYRVRSGDRLDNVTAKFFADPTQFWRIADMNRTKEADELCASPGRIVEIPAALR